MPTNLSNGAWYVKCNIARGHFTVSVELDSGPCLYRGSLLLHRARFAMSDFPFLEFSDDDVAQAGRMIARDDLVWSEGTESEIRHAFLVANNWRDAHAYPMASIRSQIIQYMRLLGIEGVTAARLKRMQAIRKKLRRPRFKHGL